MSVNKRFSDLMVPPGPANVFGHAVAPAREDWPIERIGEQAVFEELKALVDALPEVAPMSNFSRVLDPTLRGDAAVMLEKDLRLKVVGQPDAIAALVSAYQKFIAHMNKPNRPVGNLLFLGPTGTGKTKVVEALAESLFGNANNMLKIDCAEFQHSHEIAKLIGSPPGYLGHRETHPALTQEALNQFQTEKLKLSIVLFDEIEKASDALWKLMLGIMDKATLTLGDNRRVDFSQCLIVMTSNLGVSEMNNMLDGGLGFQPATPASGDKLAAKLNIVATGAAKRKFDAEFINRIDHMVTFRTLTEDDLREVLAIELGQVQRRLLWTLGPGGAFAFRASNGFKDFILQSGYDPKQGARHLNRSIEQHLVTPLANLIATKQITFGDIVRIDMLGGKITFTLEPRVERY